MIKRETPPYQEQRGFNISTFTNDCKAGLSPASAETEIRARGLKQRAARRYPTGTAPKASVTPLRDGQGFGLQRKGVLLEGDREPLRAGALRRVEGHTWG